jgi:hypothetical protein
VKIGDSCREIFGTGEGPEVNPEGSQNKEDLPVEKTVKQRFFIRLK